MSDYSEARKRSKIPGMTAWSLWGVVTLFYTFQYLLRVSPSILVTDIMQKFCIDACRLGEFSGSYYLGYALMHIPAGLMLDRLQIRWVISGCILLTIIGLLPLALTNSWELSVAGRFILGAGSSAAILSVFKVTRSYFPEAWFSRLLGVSVTLGVLGAIYGGAPMDHFSRRFGWEYVLLVLSMVGLILSLSVALFVPANQTSRKNHESIWTELKVVLTNQRILITSFCGALMVGPLEGFADVWSVPFLENVYGYDRVIAASLPPVMFLGICIGSPLIAAFAERWKAYYGITVLCAAGMAVSFFFLLLYRPSPFFTGAIFLVVGILSSYQVLVLYMNSKEVDERFGGLVAAITNMIVMSFGLVFHFAISKVMNFFWDGQVVNGLAIYKPLSYLYGISVIPLALLVALAGFIYLRRKACPTWDDLG